MKSLLSKSFVVGIVILFMGVSVSSAYHVNDKTSNPEIYIPIIEGIIDNTNSVKTIYVDDDNIEGPWDGTIDFPYQFIQDGIDNADNGDTIYVFNGLYQNKEGSIIFLMKTVKLIGEDKNITIIDQQNSGSKVYIDNGSLFTGFTVQNAAGLANDGHGISVGNNCTIDNNIIKNNDGWGIVIYGSKNTITNNKIIDNHEGLIIWPDYSSNNNTISHNIIMNNKLSGLILTGGGYNEISHNVIDNNGMKGIGIDLWVNHNEIFLNDFNNNKWAIMLFESFNNHIFNNNFYGITRIFKLTSEKMRDYWYNNYWGRARVTPKLIIGWYPAGWIIPPDDEFGTPGLPYILPYLMFDWLPASKSFDIENLDDKTF